MSKTNGEFAQRLKTLAGVVKRFDLASLTPTVRACESLLASETIDVAVLGQFKSGKSSLLNAVLGECILPVGALPVTAIVTRVAAGLEPVVQVAHLDGTVEKVALSRLAEFVTETGNSGNRRNVAMVDVFVPAMRDWSGIRLVDTPGLGSIFAHNTEATRAWMPHVAAAMVTVSAERPLSDEDVRLVSDARQTAPRVVVILTKVDLLTGAEREQVISFLKRALNEKFNSEITVLEFSTRLDSERWIQQLREKLFSRVAGNVDAERRAALSLKLNTVGQSCCEYLSLGIQAAERSDTDRNQLRGAVLNEKVSIDIIRDELSLAEQGVHTLIRPAFEEFFLRRESELTQRVSGALLAELPSWRGNLAKQARQYESWMTERLLAELTPLSFEAVDIAIDLIEKANKRFYRIVEAFRDRLNRNVREATGVTVSSAAWEAIQPPQTVAPVNVEHTFMVHWDLLWWLLPMEIVGRFFRRHAVGQVSGEIEKNLRRLVSDWAHDVDQAIVNLRQQATDWVEAELSTLDQLLSQQPDDLATFRQAFCDLDGSGESAASQS